jgi:hypothetical protein
MRNFDVPIDSGEAILDESSGIITDSEGNAILDENLITQNVWGEEELVAGVFLNLGFTTNLYYSNFDVDIYFEGQRYIPAEFKIQAIDYGSDLSVDQCAIEMGNVDLSMSSILLNNDELGSQVVVHIGAINQSTYAIYDLHRIFTGELTGWPVLTEQKAQLVFSGLMARWQKRTLRKAQASCPWPLGGR